MKNKTLKYTVEQFDDIRYITVFDTSNRILTDLECLGDFLSNEEEIQNWLDDNGYGDEDYDFTKINKQP